MITLRTTGVRSPEAARRLGIDGADVYRMLFAGELDGGPAKDGMVYIDEVSIDAYLKRHGFGVVTDSSTGSSTGSIDTSPDEDALSTTDISRKRSSGAQNDTGGNGPSGTSEHS